MARPANGQLADCLFQARRDKKLTQKDLSHMTGIPQPTISQLEQGKLNPSYKTIQRLATAMGKKVQVVLMDIN